jgi:hypothetical protein
MSNGSNEGIAPNAKRLLFAGFMAILAAGIGFGIHTLAIGWLGIFAGVFAWYANPLWALGLICSAFRKRIPAMIFGVLALPIALTVFTDIGRQIPADEGNATKTAIVRLLPGAYLWLASLVALPFAAFLRK